MFTLLGCTWRAIEPLAISYAALSLPRKWLAPGGQSLGSSPTLGIEDGANQNSYWILSRQRTRSDLAILPSFWATGRKAGAKSGVSLNSQNKRRLLRVKKAWPLSVFSEFSTIAHFTSFRSATLLELDRTADFNMLFRLIVEASGYHLYKY